jgi:hypothetical protein
MRAAFNPKLSPAIPEPTTIKSNRSCMLKKPLWRNKVLNIAYIRCTISKNTFMKKIWMTLVLLTAVSAVTFAGDGGKKKKKKEATKTEQTDEKKSCGSETEGKACCSKKKDA